MKLLPRLLAACLLLLGTSDFVPHAFAQGANGVIYNGSPIQQPVGSLSQPPDFIAFGSVPATGAIFDSTSYADLTAANITFQPTPWDPTVNADYLFATWSMPATKATGGTGQCGLLINGALINATVQTVIFTAGSGTPNISGSWIALLTGSGSQSAKIQCETSDTNKMTVGGGGQLVIWEVNGVVPYRP